MLREKTISPGWARKRSSSGSDSASASAPPITRSAPMPTCLAISAAVLPLSPVTTWMVIPAL
ncbi:hypothetical protein ACRAWC_16720 [Leifsonia sp. L25]|uniref:hypothetical protein n=1 Tax=Leifsonia sp. L25 TaxID=3423957 RepID=UPI003D69E18D